MPKFYGPLEITDEKENQDTKTVILTLASAPGTRAHAPVRLTKKMYDISVSDQPSDWTSLRDKRIRPVVRDMLEILLNYDIKLGELEAVMGLLTQSVNMSVSAGNDFLWGQEEHERLMSDMDRVVRQIPTPAPIVNEPTNDEAGNPGTTE